MNRYWVRKTGQAEMRENIRAAIKASGMTQDQFAHKAGISFSHLVGFLGDNHWFRRDALDAVARVLDIPPAELIGASIFKDQTDRYAEFDHRPEPTEDEKNETSLKAYTQGLRGGATAAMETALEAEDPKKDGGLFEQPTTPIKPTDRTRALCCVCGTLRTSRADRKGCEPDEEDNKRRAAERCVLDLACETCGKRTTHAILRLDEHRDAAELFAAIPTQGELSRRELDALIQRLAAFSVDVHFHAGWRPHRDDVDDSDGGELYPLRYEWDTSKSRWRIDLDMAAPASVLLRLLEQTWEHIANDDFDQEWDPRKTPTITRAGEKTWATAAGDLALDLQRFLSMEREHMVADLRSEVESS